MVQQDEFALLYIPRRELTVPSSAILYSLKQPGVDMKSYIRNVMSKEVELQKLRINLDEMDLSEEDHEGLLPRNDPAEHRRGLDRHQALPIHRHAQCRRKGPLLIN